MKKAAICILFSLSACTTVEYMPVQKAHTYTKPDPAAAMMLKCDMLGFARDSDGHRLCVMRGVDRLGVQPGGVAYAPIRILPYAYPPLAPTGKGLFIHP